MGLRVISLSVLLSMWSLCGHAAAQPQTTGGQVSWEDPNRHIKVTAVYDGRTVKVQSVTAGEGSARSYLSQRSDIVVLVLNDRKERLRQFNLPDPLELRVREQPPAQPPRVVPPTIGIPDATPRIGAPDRDTQKGSPDRDAPKESKIRRRSVQFEVFIPRLEGARWIEFRAGKPDGRLLGRADLSVLR